MTTSARLPIAADRAGPCVRTIRIVGMDLTEVPQRIEVRLQPDNPILLFALALVGDPRAEGLCLLDVETDVTGLKTSVVQIRIAKATMQDVTKIPYFGEIGTSAMLAYGWTITLDGDDDQIACGAFEVVPTVSGADLAPFNRPAGYGACSPSLPIWKSVQLTFGGEEVSIVVDGAQLLAPLVRDAAASRDAAAAHAATASLAAATALAASRYFSSRAAGEAASVADQLFSTDDGGGNLIYYRRTVDGSTEIGRALTPLALAAAGGAALVGFGTGTVARKFGEQYSLIDAGAKGDGATDDGSTIAAQINPIIVPRQDFYIGESINVDVHVDMRPGSRLILPPGVVLTPRAGWCADHLEQIFVGSNLGRGTVDLGKVKLAGAGIYPEWWGAVANDGAHNNSPDIMAAYAGCGSHPLVFQPAEYYYADTLVFDIGYRNLRGAGNQYSGDIGSCTRMLVLGGTKAALQFGPTADPGAPNNYLAGLDARGFHFSRTAAPDIDSNCPTIIHTHTLSAVFEDIMGSEGISCWLVKQVIYAKHNRCRAQRASAGTTSLGTADKAIGFDIDSTTKITNAAGGNASVDFSDCNSTLAGAASTIAGGTCVSVHGFYTDTRLTRFETGGSPVGINVEGSLGGDPAANADLYIESSRCDGHTFAPVLIKNVAPGGSAHIMSQYAGPSGGGVQAGVHILDCGGTVTLQDGEADMLGAPGAPGVRIANSPSAAVNQTIVSECSSGDGSIVVDRSDGAVIRGMTSNVINSVARAVLIGRSNACIVEQQLKTTSTSSGGAPKIGEGVRIIDDTSARNEVRCGPLNSDMIAGGAGNKLIVGSAGTQIRAAGIISAGAGNNLASGVMD